MAIRFSYRFAPLAESDLNEVLLYIEQELYNTKAANDFATELFQKIDNIIEFPLSGKGIDNEFIPDKDLRKFVVGKYIVFYKPDREKDKIIIVRIIYGARNLDEIIRTII